MARVALGGKRVRKRVIFRVPKTPLFGGGFWGYFRGFLGVLGGTPKKAKFDPKTRVLDPLARGGPGPGFDRFLGVRGGYPGYPPKPRIGTHPTPGDPGGRPRGPGGSGGGPPRSRGIPRGWWDPGSGGSDPVAGGDRSYPTKVSKPSRPWSRTNGGWPGDHDRRGDLGSETSC